MIRRLYVDNFRSLVDFTWEPGKECLVLGYKGSGKTSALDAIEIIRNWNLGWEHVLETLSSRESSRFTDQDHIYFELELEVAGEAFHYRLRLEFSEANKELTGVQEYLGSNRGGTFDRKDNATQFAYGSAFPAPLLEAPVRSAKVPRPF